MKKYINSFHVKSVLILISLVIQSVEPVTIAQLSTEFKEVKRGVTCLATGNACSKEDKEATWAAVKVLGAIGLILASIWGYKKRQVIREFLTSTPKERKAEKRAQSSKKEEKSDKDVQGLPTKAEKPKYTIKKVTYNPTDQELKETLAWALHKELQEPFLMIKKINFLLNNGADLAIINKLEYHKKIIYEKIDIIQDSLNMDKDGGVTLKDRLQKRNDEINVLNALGKNISFPDQFKQDYALQLYHSNQNNRLISGIDDDEIKRITDALQKGADPNYMSPVAGHVLAYALLQNKYAIAKKLMHYGADPEQYIVGNPTLMGGELPTIRNRYPKVIEKIENELSKE